MSRLFGRAFALSSAFNFYELSLRVSLSKMKLRVSIQMMMEITASGILSLRR